MFLYWHYLAQLEAIQICLVPLHGVLYVQECININLAESNSKL